MSVTLDDVRHIASLARLGLSEPRAEALVAELNTILQHMDVLSEVDTSTVADESITSVSGAAPLRLDAGPPIPLARSREAMAPRMQDGFFLVPRLSTHEDLEASS
ncbi:MAG: Asp-tRNA(Asn)/Glu-tRNA(Gln) amidotransferase subunit GatC [bacterium]